jgi:hypothetical protein
MRARFVGFNFENLRPKTTALADTMRHARGPHPYGTHSKLYPLRESIVPILWKGRVIRFAEHLWLPIESHLLCSTCEGPTGLTLAPLDRANTKYNTFKTFASGRFGLCHIIGRQL